MIKKQKFLSIMLSTLLLISATSACTFKMAEKQKVDLLQNEKVLLGTTLVTLQNVRRHTVGDASIQPISPLNNAEVCLTNEEVSEFVKNYTVGSSLAYWGQGDHFKMKGVTLSWNIATQADSYEVLIADNALFTNPQKYIVQSENLVVQDLFVTTQYYWTVGAVYGETAPVWSEIFTFKTADTPRTISIEGVSNSRDIGGKMTTSGKRIKQGMVYRSAYLDEITDEGIKKAIEVYGIKTDLDLRNPGEQSAGCGSPLGKSVRYVNMSTPYYLGEETGLCNEQLLENLAEEIRLFANEDNYPILFHCSVGRDRTGTLAMILEALLGVSEQDIFMDYELTSFSYRGTMDGTKLSALLASFTPTYNGINNFGPGESLSEHCEQFLLTIGVTATEIAQIKANLLV